MCCSHLKAHSFWVDYHIFTVNSLSASFSFSFFSPSLISLTDFAFVWQQDCALRLYLFIDVELSISWQSLWACSSFLFPQDCFCFHFFGSRTELPGSYMHIKLSTDGHHHGHIPQDIFFNLSLLWLQVTRLHFELDSLIQFRALSRFTIIIISWCRCLCVRRWCCDEDLFTLHTSSFGENQAYEESSADFNYFVSGYTWTLPLYMHGCMWRTGIQISGKIDLILDCKTQGISLCVSLCTKKSSNRTSLLVSFENLGRIFRTRFTFQCTHVAVSDAYDVNTTYCVWLCSIVTIHAVDFFDFFFCWTWLNHLGVHYLFKNVCLGLTWIT